MCDGVQKVHKVFVTSTLLEWRKDNPFVLYG